MVEITYSNDSVECFVGNFSDEFLDEVAAYYRIRTDPTVMDAIVLAIKLGRITYNDVWAIAKVTRLKKIKARHD